MPNEQQVKLSQEAKPFMRYGAEKMPGVAVSADSDSGACESGQCACGTGGGECAHVPPMPKLRP